MTRSWGSQPLGLAVVAVALAALVAPSAPAARTSVSSPGEFDRAVAAARTTGGTIVLRPGTYARPLVVGPRSASRLTIRGSGARVHLLVLDRTQAVTIRGLTVRPVVGAGGILVRRSRGIVVDRVRFTAAPADRVSLDLERSIGVLVERSDFSHCGDLEPGSAPCLFPRWATGVTVRRNRFHHCRGCDGVHGRAGRNLVIEENRFERAPPCVGTRKKCNHQDAIELFAGNGVTIRRNVFGPTGRGRAQIFLSEGTHQVRIVNNLLHVLGGGAPGVTPRRGIVVGTRISRDLPRDVKIVNNTILTGDIAGDDEASSIIVTPFFEDAPKGIRPVIVNNVVARIRASHLCGRVRLARRNVAGRGRACSAADAVGNPMLTHDGRPTAASTLLIDRAAPLFAPPRDILGRVRGSAPDIGAYEFRP